MHQLTDETLAFLQNNPMTKFHLGCGNVFLRGWLNIGFWPELQQGQIYLNPNGVQGAVYLNHDLRYGLPTNPGELTVIYHSHFLEHLTYTEGLELLSRCFESLKLGGVHRIVVPDLAAFARAYLTEDDALIEKYRDGVFGNRREMFPTKASVFMGMIYSHEHRWCYDWDSLRWALEQVGFRSIRRTLLQESELTDIGDIEPNIPLRALESLCVECRKV